VGFWTLILASRITDAEIFECLPLLRYNNTEVFGIYDHIYEIAKQRNLHNNNSKVEISSRIFLQKCMTVRAYISSGDSAKQCHVGQEGVLWRKCLFFQYALLDAKSSKCGFFSITDRTKIQLVNFFWFVCTAFVLGSSDTNHARFL
jgi:hypothetical protein